MIVIKTENEIEQMRRAGAFAFELLEMAQGMVKPGISTLEINDLLHEHTLKAGGKSAPLGYRGFPKSLCTSINEVICHGIPCAEAILKQGDIINVDVTPILGGYHGDSSRTFCVGKVSEDAKRLVDTAKDCLDAGIEAVQDGCRLGDIGEAIQSLAESQGYSVVRDFVGHGIGRVFHEEPQIPHYGKKGRGPRLTKGMTFTIEPMINIGRYESKILADKWTAITKDRSLSAQFEHTLAIRHDGTVEILTRA